MEENRELTNETLEKVAGGDDSTQECLGFKIGDWVRIARGTTRQSPQGYKAYYRITDFLHTDTPLPFAKLDSYMINFEGGLENMGYYGTFEVQDLGHAADPFFPYKN